MKELKELIDVKSIVTIMITTTWSILAAALIFSYIVNPTSRYDMQIQVWNDVQKVFLMVVCFFFGTQYQKNKQYEENGGPRL